MKKAVTLAAVAAIAATAITGAAAAPPAEHVTSHTKRFVSHDIDSHQLGPNTFAGAAIDRRFGHVVAYEAFTGHSHPRLGTATIWDSFAFRDGTISVVVRAGGGSVFGGDILNGTGKYKGVHGTVSVRPSPHDPEKTFITLTYYL